MNPLAAILAQHPFFSALGQDALDEILQKGALRSLEKGEIIHSQGDLAQGLHLVVSGKVRVYRCSTSGKEQNLRCLLPGQEFGDISAFDGGPTIGCAAAVEPATVLVLPVGLLKQLAATHHDVAIGILQHWARRVRDLSQLAGRLSMEQVICRVAGVMIQLTRGGAEGILPKKEDLATTVGTVREVATRAVKQLERDGLIRLGPRRRFSVIDRKGLEAFGERWPVPPASVSAAALSVPRTVPA